MRICVFALATIALAQPAFARDHAHRHSHHGVRSHHHNYAAHHHRRFARAAHIRREPIESGYSMPQSFARTDASDTPFWNSDPSFGHRAWAPAAQPAPFGESVQPRLARRERGHDGTLDTMIARHAAANGLPVALVHRVVTRESGYNPRARNSGALGLMQIKYATARGVGYTGSAAGLLGPETNLTYAVRYLAGAYRTAGGNAGRAVAYYASGYHGRGG
jgi:soluble lytic murein transglycosylase-like protein